jgi:hypothetical protein
MRPIRIATAVIALVLLATGCSASSAGDSATGSASSSTPTGPTIRQFASVIATNEAKIEQTYATLTSHNCVMPSGVWATTCSYTVLTVVLEGKTLAKDLNEVGTPVPSEISDLVAKTSAAATALGAEDASICENSTEDACCWGTEARIKFATQNLLDLLAGWKPYM